MAAPVYWLTRTKGTCGIPCLFRTSGLDTTGSWRRLDSWQGCGMERLFGIQEGSRESVLSNDKDIQIQWREDTEGGNEAENEDLTWLPTTNLKEDTGRLRTLSPHFIILSITGLVELREHQLLRYLGHTYHLAADGDGFRNHLHIYFEVGHTERHEGFPRAFANRLWVCKLERNAKAFQPTSSLKPKAAGAQQSQMSSLKKEEDKDFWQASGVLFCQHPMDASCIRT